MPDYNIHEIQERDLSSLSRLYDQLTGEPTDQKKLHSVFKEIEKDSHYVVFGVYDDTEKLIATATLSKCLDLSNDVLFYYNMENFVVDKDHRHEGIGKLLLKELENYVIQHHGRYMNFTSAASRAPAHAFYKACGYDPNDVKGFKKRFF